MQPLMPASQSFFMQPLNARQPILATLFDYTADIKPTQYENAQSSMVVTLLGIVYAPMLTG
jgi:hypothetical protein